MRKAFVYRENVDAGGVVLLLLILLVVCFPYFESIRHANERPRLMQSMALIDELSFAIDGSGGRGLDPGPDVSRGRGGRLYPNKPPGASIVGAGAYLAASWTHAAIDRDLTLRAFTAWARIFGSVIPTLVLCGFMFRRYAGSFGRGPAAFAVLLYALGTPAASYAHLFYGHQLAACLVLVGVELLCAARTAGRGDFAWLGGLLASAAIAVEYGAVFAGVPLGVMLVLGVRGRRGLRVLAHALGCALIPVALLALYHQSAFGSPWSTGYHHASTAAFASAHGKGLLGLSWPSSSGFYTHFLAPAGGLVWWAPLFPLGLYGLAQLAFERGAFRVVARVHLTTFVIFVLVASGLVFDGGWRVGPRYMVLVLPVLVLGWAHVFAQLRTEPRWMFPVVAFATYSVVANTLAANLWPHFDVTNVNQPVSEVLMPLLSQGREVYSLPRWLLGVHGTWFVLVASGLGLLYAEARCMEIGARKVGALMFGTLMGIMLMRIPDMVPDHEHAPRNLAYIERVWEPTPGSPAPHSFILERNVAFSTGPEQPPDP